MNLIRKLILKRFVHSSLEIVARGSEKLKSEFSLEAFNNRVISYKNKIREYDCAITDYDHVLGIKLSN